MEIIRSYLIDTSNPEKVLNEFSKFYGITENRIIDKKRIFAKIWKRTLLDLNNSEKIIKKIVGVKDYTILTTQYSSYLNDNIKSE